LNLKLFLSKRVKVKSNTKRFKKAFFRAVAFITLISFLSQQILFAEQSQPEPVQQIETGQYTPVITPEQYEARHNAPSASGQINVDTDDYFLKDDSPLKPVRSSDFSRLDETAEAATTNGISDLLREDFAYAAVLKDLSERDIQTLLDADVEVGLIVVEGEIVLFTSGSADEIRTAPAAQELFERASLIAHTHPREEQSSGPSGKDIDSARGGEYVITEAGVYVYDSTGVKGKISFQEFVERVRSSDFNRLATEVATTNVRDLLNQFIADTDSMVLFRAGGTVNYSTTLTPDDVSTLAGKPDPILTGGSSPDSRFAQAGAETASIIYDVTQAFTYAGVTLNFDDFGTLPFESGNLSALTQWVFGVATDADRVFLEIEDADGDRDTLTLINTTSGERIYEIDPALIATSVDRSRIRLINFVVKNGFISNGNLTGDLSIHAKGLAPSFVNQSAVVDLTSFSDMAGFPRRMKTLSSSQGTSVIFTDSQNMTLHYDVTSPNTYSGFTLAYDDFGSAPIEFFDLSLKPVMAIGLQGDPEKVRLEIQDASGRRVNLSLEGISAAQEKFYKIDFSQLASNLDLKRIAFINFVEDQFTVGPVKSGNLKIRYGTFVPDTTPPLIAVSSAALTNNPVYALRYTVDGVQKSEVKNLTEGANAFEIIERDLSGNETRANFSVTLDTVPPQIIMTSPALTNQMNYALNYTIDGIPHSAIYPLTEGVNTLTLTDSDPAGNSSTVNFDVILDTQPPYLVLRSSYLVNDSHYLLEYTADGVLKSQAYTLSEGSNPITIVERDLAGNEVRSTIDVVLDSIAPLVVATSVALTNNPNYLFTYTVDGFQKTEARNLTEGANILTVTERDTAGNETTSIWIVTLDTVPPQIAFRSAALTNNASYTLEYYLDGVLFSKPVTLSEGENVIPIVERDLAGNETSIDYRVTLDTIAPQIIFTSAALTNQPFYALAYTVDGANHSEMFQLQEGENVITRSFTDPAGNPASETLRVTLDTQPPYLVLRSSYLVNDSHYLLEYTADGVLKSQAYTLSEGSNPITIVEHDLAGNEVRSTIDVVLDSIAPLVVATSVALTNNPNYLFTYTVDGVQKTEVKTLSEGSNDLGVTEKDTAGNETKTTFNVILDTVPPKVTVSSPALVRSADYDLEYTADGRTVLSKIFLSEGKNTITITERDAAGNETRVDYAVTLDSIAPQIVFTSQTLVNQANYVLTYTSDGNPVAKSFILNEGVNVLTVTETDAAGNQTVKDCPVTLDSIAPQVIFTSSALVNHSNYVLTYMVDGLSKSETHVLAEGANVFTVTETDAAGNQTVIDYSVTLDSVAPDIQFISPMLVKDPDYLLAYTVDGVQKTESLRLVEGENIFTRSETDLAGNASSKTLRVTLDTVPPQVILKSQMLTNQINYSLQYELDGILTQETVVLTEGPNSIARTFTDAAGNSMDVTFSIMLDTKSPTVNLISPVLVNQSTYVLDYTVEGIPVQESVTLAEGLNVFHRGGQDAAGNQWSVDFQIELDTVPAALVFRSGDLVNGANYLLEYTVDGVLRSEPVTLVEGENTFTRTETDIAGNSTTVLFKVTLDTLPPQITVNSAPLVNNPNYIFEYTAEGVLKTETVTLTEGDNVFVRTETDAAGNSSTVSFRVTLDSIAPQITFTSSALVRDPDYALAYTVDGTPRTTAVQLIEGENVISLTEVDMAGNSTASTFKVTLDTVPPAVQFTSPVLTNSTNYVLTYMTDGVPVSRTLFLTEGDNVISVVERDLIGNETHVSITVTLDTQPPYLVLRSSYLVNDSHYLLEYTADGVLKSQAYTLSEGSNPITIVEHDLAGNEVRSTIDVVLDSIAPLVVATSAALTNDPNYLLAYTVDGALHTAAHTLIEGVNHLQISETDAAGNSSIRIHDVTLDTIAPAILITSPTRIVDGAAGVPYALQYSVDGQAVSESVTLVQGPNLFTRSAQDAAGNSRTVTFTVLLESPPPPDPEPPQIFLSVFTLPGEEVIPDFISTQPPASEDTVVLKDGSVLSDIELDKDGELETFTRTLAFGVVQTVVDGILKTQKNIDQSVYELNAFGGVVRILQPDGSVILIIQTSADGKIMHYWIERATGEKLEVVNDRVMRRVDPDGTVKVFDSEGVLVRIEKSDGQIWSDLGFGVDGHLARVTKKLIDGTHLIGDVMTTQREIAPDGTLRILDPHTNFLIQILPDQTREEFIGERKLREITADGTLIEFSTSSQIQRIVNPDGSEIRYLADGRIVIARSEATKQSQKIFQEIAAQLPAARDDTTSVLLGNGIRAKLNGEKISELVFQDGTKVVSPQFSGTGEITGGRVEYANGITDIIFNSSVIRREFPGNLQIDFAPAGKLVRVLKAGQLIGESALPELVEKSVLEMVQKTLEQGKVELADHSILELNGNMLERETENGLVQKFENGKLTRFTTPEGEEYEAISETEFRLVSLDLGNGAHAYFNESGFERLEFADGRVVSSLEELDLAARGVKLMRDGRYSIQKEAFTYFYDAAGNLSEILNDDKKFFVENGKVRRLQMGKSVVSYDDSGALDTISLANGEKYRFDRAGNLFQVVTPSGNKIIYQGSKISSFMDASGKKIRLYREFNSRTQTEEVSVSDSLGEPDVKRGLISYLLRDIDQRKEDALVTELADLFDITNSLGAFHTPPDKAVESFATDPDRARVSRLDYQVSPGPGSWMGLYAKAPNVDISQYEYISVGMKGTPGPVKIELKGTGQIFEFHLTGEWQDFVLPVKGRSGEISEITVLVNEPQSSEGTRLPASRSGFVLLDHMAFFNPKLEEKPDWQAETGITAAEFSALYQSASRLPMAKLPVLDPAMSRKLSETPAVLKYDADGTLSQLAFLTTPKPLQATEEKITTHYEYDTNGGLKSAKLDYQGVPIGNFEYKFEEGTSVIKAEDGSARRYNTTGELIGMINPDGTEYEIIYENGTLKSINLKRQYLDGVTRNYSDGKLASVDLKDGSGIFDLTFAEDGTMSGGVLETPDGIQTRIVNGFPAETRYPSGTVRPVAQPDYEVIGWSEDRFAVRRGTNILKYDESGNLRQVIAESGENLLIVPGKERASVRYFTPREIGGVKIPAREIMNFASAEKGLSLRIGDSLIYENETGFVLLVVDPASGNVTNQAKFDLSKSDSAMELALFLRTVPADSFLMGSYGGGGMTFANELDRYLVKSGLEKFGLKGFDSLAPASNWAFIGKLGAEAAAAIESTGAKINLASHDETRGSLAVENGRLMPGTLGFDEELIGGGLAYHKNFVAEDPESGFFRVRRGNDGNFSELTDSFVDQMLGLVASREEVYVYFDGRYPSNWITEDGTIRLKSALAKRGLKIVDADQMAEIMRVNPKAAFIFTQDIAPETVFDPVRGNYLVKEFLESGGSMVWLHDTPFYYVGHAGINQKSVMGGGIENYILGIDRSNLVASKKEIAGGILEEALSTALPVKALQLYSRFETASVASPLDARDALLSRFDESGKNEYVLRADGSEVFYENGNIRKIAGADGKVEMEYLYDAEGNITRIHLYKEMEQIPAAVEEERVIIEKKRDAMLAMLPDQEAYLIARIEEEVAKQKASIQSQIASLESQRYQTVTYTTGFWIFKKTHTQRVENPAVVQAIGQLQGALVTLEQEGGKAVRETRLKIIETRAQILSESEKAIANLPEREKELRRAVLLEEMAPVVAQTYRDLLGRDPSQEEIESCVRSGDFSRSSLLNSPERQLKLERKASIISRVREMLASREHSLSEEELSNIFTWLENRNLHFGESAWGPLQKLLEANGINLPAEQLAAEAVVEDILSKVINPATGGELMLSLNALDEIARRHGLETSAHRVDIPEENTIALINGNHFVLVKSVTGGNVTYFDQSIGASGSEISIPLEDFQSVFSGFILAPKSQIPAPELTETEAKSIRGSFFFLIPVIIGAIAGAIASAAAAAVAAAGAAIASALAGIGSAIAGLTTSIGSLLSGFVGSLNFSSFGAGLASVGKIAGAVSLTSFGAQLGAQAFGWDGAANVLGVISQISGLVSLGANVALGAANLFKNGLQSGIQSITKTVQNIGAKIWNGVTSIASTVGNAVKGIGGFAVDLIQGAGKIVSGFTNGGFLEGLKSIGSGLMSGVNGTFDLIGKGIVKGIDFVGQGVKWIDSKIGNLFSNSLGNQSAATGTKISKSIYDNLVNVAVGSAVNKTLDQVGIDGSFARLATAMAMGAYADPANILGGSLRTLAMQGVSEAALKLDLPPPVAAALTTITGLMTDNLFDPSARSIFSNFDKITPDLFTQGFTYLGTELGLSPTVSALIAGPVGGSLGALAVGTATQQSVQTILKNMSKEFTRGLATAGTSIAVTKVFDAIDAPPAAENIVRNLLTSVTSNLFRDKTGREPTAEEAETGTDRIFDKLGEGLKRFGNGVKSAVGTVVSFGQKIVEGVGHVMAQGFKNTIGAFSSLFSPKTQEYIYEDIQGLRQGTVTAEGDIWTYQVGSSKIEYNVATDYFTESSAGYGTAKISGLGMSDGGSIYYDRLTFESISSGAGTLTQNYHQGRFESFQADVEGGLGIFIEAPMDESFTVDAYKVIKEGRVTIDVPAELGAPWESLIYFDIHDGQVSEAKIEIKTEPQTRTDINLNLDKELYVLVNGVDNSNDLGAPLYMRNLESDLVRQSQNTDTHLSAYDDILAAATFLPNSIIEKILNSTLGQTAARAMLRKLMDAWQVFQTQMGQDFETAGDVKTALENFFDEHGDGHRLREKIGVGYSGGFIPLVAAFADPQYNDTVQAFVALGGATFAIGAKLAEALQVLIEAAENAVTVRDDSTRAALGKAADLFVLALEKYPFAGVVAKAVSLAYGFLDHVYMIVDKQALDQKFNEFYAQLKSLIEPYTGFDWNNLTLTNAELVVNVWGTEDFIAKGNVVGGYLDHIGNFRVDSKTEPLYNIEIIGADHLDYIKGVRDFSTIADSVIRAEAEYRNEVVSTFVADLILNAKSADALERFLSKSFIQKIDENHYQIDLGLS